MGMRSICGYTGMGIWHVQVYGCVDMWMRTGSAGRAYIIKGDEHSPYLASTRRRSAGERL